MKEEMLKNITRLEHDITKTEENIRKLKKKMTTLKENSAAAASGAVKKEEIVVKSEIADANDLHAVGGSAGGAAGAVGSGLKIGGIKDEKFSVKKEEGEEQAPGTTSESGVAGGAVVGGGGGDAAVAASAASALTESTPKHLLMAQRIYAENRQKVKQSLLLNTEEGGSDPLPADSQHDVPLYNQPSDTPVYHHNKKFHARFRVKLMKYFKKKHHAKKVRERFLSEKYDQLSQEWLKKMEKISISLSLYKEKYQSLYLYCIPI